MQVWKAADYEKYFLLERNVFTDGDIKKRNCVYMTSILDHWATRALRL